MRFNSSFSIVLTVVFVLSPASVGFGADDVGLSGMTAGAGDANEVGGLSFPYIAEVTEDSVNIRSGPGTNYYRCGKLNKFDRVKIVSTQHTWSRIVPPPGSFSWISKQYVDIDPDNPGVGSVTGDGVRVYAGSDYIKPVHSTTMQLKLNTTDNVTLMGEEGGDYYKVVPPGGAYLWVSSKYVRAIGQLDEVAMLEIPVKDRELKAYYDLEKRIAAEQAKPMAQQNYVDIKKKLAGIADSKDAGKAARYAGFAIRRIKRFELALDVNKAVKLQDAQLEHVRKQIKRASAIKLANVPDLGNFAVVGQFQTSNIYDPESEFIHYRVIDNSGKTLCYALPKASAAKINLDEFVGRRVGLLGQIKPHEQTGWALVEFTEIIGL